LNGKFSRAIKEGDEELFERCILERHRLDDVDVDGDSYLHVAARYGRTEMAEELILQSRRAFSPEDVDPGKIDVDARNVRGETPLAVACRYARLETAELLLDYGADANATNAYGYTVLMETASPIISTNSVYAGTAKLLLDRGAEIDARDEAGYTALARASKNGRSEIVKLLIDEGADPALRTGSGETAAELASTDEIRAFLIAAERRIEANRALARGEDFHLSV